MVKRRRRNRGRSPFSGRLLDRIQETVIVLVVAIVVLAVVADFLANSPSRLTLLTLVLSIIGIVVAVVGFYWGKWLVNMIRYIRRRNRRFHAYTHFALEELRAIDPFEFEHVVGFVFERHGYGFTPTKVRGDHGVDGVLSLAGKRYALQVKKYGAKQAVGAPEVREFFGSFVDGGYTSGMLVTTSDFTPPAKIWASKRPIQLIAGNELVRLLRSGTEPPWWKLVAQAFWSVPFAEKNRISFKIPVGSAKSPKQKVDTTPRLYKKFWQD